MSKIAPVATAAAAMRLASIYPQAEAAATAHAPCRECTHSMGAPTCYQKGVKLRSFPQGFLCDPAAFSPCRVSYVQYTLHTADHAPEPSTQSNEKTKLTSPTHDNSTPTRLALQPVAAVTSSLLQHTGLETCMAARCTTTLRLNHCWRCVLRICTMHAAQWHSACSCHAG